MLKKAEHNTCKEKMAHKKLVYKDHRKRDKQQQGIYKKKIKMKNINFNLESQKSEVLRNTSNIYFNKCSMVTLMHITGYILTCSKSSHTLSIYKAFFLPKF